MIIMTYCCLLKLNFIFVECNADIVMLMLVEAIELRNVRMIFKTSWLEIQVGNFKFCDSNSTILGQLNSK